MSLIHLENENFNELISDYAVVDFYATWCGPCKMLGPIFEEVAMDSDINFIKIDIDKHEAKAREYKVMSVPTIIIFRNGVEIKRHIGFISKDDLLELIKN